MSTQDPGPERDARQQCRHIRPTAASWGGRRSRKGRQSNRRLAGLAALLILPFVLALNVILVFFFGRDGAMLFVESFPVYTASFTLLFVMPTYWIWEDLKRAKMSYMWLVAGLLNYFGLALYLLECNGRGRVG